jgi:hypothetical protein
MMNAEVDVHRHRLAPPMVVAAALAVSLLACGLAGGGTRDGGLPAVPDPVEPLVWTLADVPPQAICSPVVPALGVTALFELTATVPVATVAVTVVVSGPFDWDAALLVRPLAGPCTARLVPLQLNAFFIETREFSGSAEIPATGASLTVVAITRATLRDLTCGPGDCVDVVDTVYGVSQTVEATP